MFPNFIKNSIRRVYTLLVVLLIIIWLPANAQHRGSAGINADGDVLSGSSHNSGGYIAQDGWLIALNLGYESPLGDMKEIYKGAPTFGVTVGKRMGSLVYTGTVDYRVYKPIQSNISYTDDLYSYTATYGNYSGIGLYAGVAYELPLGSSATMYGGINGGYIIASFKMTIQGDGIDGSTESAGSSVTYIAPKLGFNFAVSNSMSIGLEARYSLGTVGANYNSREGGTVTPGFNSYAGNVFLIHSF
ncbi:hypothetical protein [Mucilaginibacter phyllosphaerae]|nr:hypothetical protein [Mucilaginibacter phyllosphaerae]